MAWMVAAVARATFRQDAGVGQRGAVAQLRRTVQNGVVGCRQSLDQPGARQVPGHQVYAVLGEPDESLPPRDVGQLVEHGDTCSDGPDDVVHEVRADEALAPDHEDGKMSSSMRHISLRGLGHQGLR